MAISTIIPINEKERIKALKRYEILDTPPDGAFDHVTAIAAKIFDVPIALVTLVDENRIWFKAKHGLDSVDQINRDPGLCASAILSEDVYDISDTLKDARTLANPLVAGEFGLRFYAAAPLKTKDGFGLGTVCLLDKKPKELTDNEKEILENLAGIVMDEMELRLSALTATRKYKESADELRQHKDRLEIEVEKRTAELTKSNNELRRSNHDLEQFAFVSSHDLKEPIRVLSIYSQLLSTKYAENLDDEGKLFLNYIVEGSERMKCLINDLLSYSKLGREKMQIETVDMNQVLNAALENLAGSIESSGAIIKADHLPKVESVFSQMVQVLQNLLENAIKFKREENPQIKVGVEKQENNWVFSIADNGIGIDKTYEHRIFEIFQRLHERNEFTGTGIGLAVCKKIIDYNGGKIWFESEINKGTTFYFSLPNTAKQEN